MEAAAPLLERPLLRTSHLLSLHAALTLIEACEASGSGLLGELSHRALDGALEWLAERELPGYMAPLIERFGHLCSRRELTRWRTTVRELGRRRMQSRDDGNSRLTVSMLGTIDVTLADAGRQPLRGARARVVLGLLVAARLLKAPLTSVDFCRIASGDELNLELARKTTNMAIVRLREALGADAIITGDDTHELNLAVVGVDLLEAHHLLLEARTALRRRALLRAAASIGRALEIVRGEVPFPGLYDDLFEALREDFETRLRTTVVDVAQAHLAESDAASAERLLRLGLASLPDDEELATLLRDALTAQGRRADAEHTRIAAEYSSLE